MVLMLIICLPGCEEEELDILVEEVKTMLKNIGRDKIMMVH